MNRYGLLLAVLPLVLAAQKPARTGGDSAADVPPKLAQDVKAGNQDWIEGLKVGDADRIAASYSSDSVFVNAAGDCVRGPAAIAALYREVMAKFGRATEAFVRSDALRADHDLAFESGFAEARFANGAVRRGRYSTVWKLQADGRWKIVRNMSLPAPD